MKASLRALTCAFVLASSAVAQVAAQTPLAGIIPAIAPTGTAILRTGTEVPLKLSEQLTTKNKAVRVGQRFRLNVAEDVRVDGHVVIPVGSPAVGEVTDVRNKGMWGKSGHLGARVLYVTVNGRQIRLSGSFDDKGVAGGIAAVTVSAIVFLPAGFFMTGTSANIPSGSSVKAFVDEDVPLAFATAAQAPLQVPVAASPLAVGSPIPTAVAAPASSPVPGAASPTGSKPSGAVTCVTC